MSVSLYPSRQLAAVITLCGITLCSLPAQSASGTFAMPTLSQISSPEAVLLEPSHAPLIANHGGEGSSATIITGATAAPVLTAVQGHVSKGVFSNSLWGNLLLSMAFQRDAEIQKLIQKSNRVSGLTLLSIAGVSGLGLAQSIYALNKIESQTLDVEIHDDGDQHVHIPKESKVPSTLGIIGSGVTLATLGFNFVMSKHYKAKLTARQTIIKDQIAEVLAKLKAGGESPQIKGILLTLVGDEATEEFLSLWQATHPTP